jgi:hypothetical protein
MIRMMDEILGMALLNGHLQGLQDQLRAQVSCHGPADDLVAPGVEHHSQIQEPSPRWDVGNTCTTRKCRCVGHPQFIRAAGSEVTLDQNGADFASAHLWVVRGALRRLTPRKSAACIRRAPRLRPTCRPCSANSAWIRGVPWVDTPDHHNGPLDLFRNFWVPED